MLLPPDRPARLRDRAFPPTGAGDLKPIIGAVLPLAGAAEAHRALEERTAIGKTVLTP
ncbi:zinc-binding dehydrogenase [Nocardiopsis mangrovi]|uniref:Zinc-binding dehydrogenase n=1 Tax=Nocardiopsis mangrovi TaxID=1179818 RepID=A0ABV9E2H5_9ACTN